MGACHSLRTILDGNKQTVNLEYFMFQILCGNILRHCIFIFFTQAMLTFEPMGCKATMDEISDYAV